MLQYVTTSSPRWTLQQQVSNAIEGGCKWIELRDDSVTPADRHEALRLAAEQVLPLCKAEGVFLIVNGDPELAAEMELYGVHLNHGCQSPRQVRADLGAGAIIGVTVETADEIIALKGADIDYVTVVGNDPLKIAEIAAATSQAGVQIPIVAFGDIDLQNARSFINAGASGVAVDSAICMADDPVSYTAELLQAIGA